jgi:hypothetical protein
MPSWLASISFKRTARNEEKWKMAKAKKAEITEESKHDDTHDIGSTMKAGLSDEPPIDESNYEPIDEYADDIGIDASNADADVDHPTDDGADGPHYDRDYEDRESDAGDALVSPKQLEILRTGGDRLQRPLSFMKCDEYSNFTIKGANATGSKLLAIPDWAIVQRTLFIKGMGVECHGYRWAELEGQPPRPDTFTDRTRWKDYSKNGKESDPWNNISIILPLTDSSGGIISFQGDRAETRIAIGRLLKAFDGRRRPIVELTHEKNPDSLIEGAKIPVLRIVGYADKNENFDFLREMLIRDDPKYPEPQKKKEDGDW